MVDPVVQDRSVYWQLFQELNDPAYFVDPENGAILEVNKAAVRFLGYTREELLEMKVDDVAVGESTQKMWKSHDPDLTKHRSLIFETEHRKKDGSIYPVEVSVKKLKKEGHFYLVTVARDITRRRENEQKIRESSERLELLTKVAPVGIFRTDKQGKCIYVNEPWMAISGLSFEEAKGEGWIQAIHPEDREEVFQLWEDAVAESRIFSHEYRFLSPEGKVSWVLGKAVQEPSEKGEFVGTITDITEQKKMLENLMDSYRHVGLINRQVGALYELKQMKDKVLKDEKLLDYVLQLALSISHAKTVGLQMYDEQTKAFYLKKEKGMTSELRDRITCLRINDYPFLKPLLDFKKIYGKGKNVPAFLGVPLVSDKKLIGAFFFNFESEDEIPVNYLHFYEILADRIGDIVVAAL